MTRAVQRSELHLMLNQSKRLVGPAHLIQKCNQEFSGCGIRRIDINGLAACRNCVLHPAALLEFECGQDLLKRWIMYPVGSETVYRPKNHDDGYGETDGGAAAR